MHDHKIEAGPMLARVARHLMKPGEIHREYYCARCFEHLNQLYAQDGRARCPSCGQQNELAPG